MTPRGSTRLKIWLVLVGVFALGCMTGAFSTVPIVCRPARRP